MYNGIKGRQDVEKNSALSLSMGWMTLAEPYVPLGLPIDTIVHDCINYVLVLW